MVNYCEILPKEGKKEDDFLLLLLMLLNAGMNIQSMEYAGLTVATSRSRGGAHQRAHPVVDDRTESKA